MEEFAIPGVPRIFLNACTSSANAIGHAFRAIRGGRAEVALCGGYDALCAFGFTGFHSLQALTTDVCRPFDRNRDGLSIGEGAGILVLESWDRARARGVPIVGEIVGYGESTDAFHMTRPEPEGRTAARAIHAAIRDAGIDAEDVDYVNAHGTGTPFNDRSETAALVAALGERRLYDSGEFHEGDDRASPGWGRCGGGDSHRAGPQRGVASAERELSDARSRLRPADRATGGTADTHAVCALQFLRFRRGQRDPGIPTRGGELLMDRIAISGIGIVSPRAFGRAAFLRTLSPDPGKDPALRVPEFALEQYLENARSFRRVADATKFALASMALAIGDAGFRPADFGGERAGLVVGISHGAVTYAVEFHRTLLLEGPLPASPLHFSESVPNAPAGNGAIAFRIRGPVHTLIGEEPVGTQAVDLAASLLYDGFVDRCLVAGTEEWNEVVAHAYAQMDHARRDGPGRRRPPRVE